MPSRTIDIGSADGSQEPRLVCHTAKGRDIVREWATLSHRWAEIPP